MDQIKTDNKPSAPARKAEQLRRPSRWVPFAMAAIALKLLQLGVIADNQVEMRPQPAPQTQEATPETDDYDADLWVKNYQRAQAEIKNRLLTDSPISYLLGSVQIIRREDGELSRAITNPILMTDSDVFEPGISHKHGAAPNENFDFAPWVVVGNHNDHDFELSIDFLDDPIYDYRFYSEDGKELEIPGVLLEQNASDFMSHVAFTTDLTVVKQDVGAGYIIQAPDGTQISRDETR